MKDQKFKNARDEIRRLPIDVQKRIRLTLIVSAAWGGFILLGSGIFLLSRPYMDRKRLERIQSGEAYEDIKRSRENSIFTRSYAARSRTHVNDSISPPAYLQAVVDQSSDNEKVKQ